MVKREVFALFVFLILMHGISAVETEIKIKTLPNHNVNVNVLNPSSGTFDLIKRFNKDSDEYGDVSFELTTDKSKVNLVISIFQGESKVISDTYLNMPTNESIEIRIAPEWFEFIESPSENNKTEILFENASSEEIPENKTRNESTEIAKKEGESNIAGLAVSGKREASSKSIIYVVAGIIVLTGIMIGAPRLIRRARKIPEPKEIKVKKLSEVMREREEKGKKSNSLQEAEKRLKEAQEEVKRLRIEELKNRINEEKRELKKLEKEE